MLKRDSLTAQLQQLNQVLARVKRLIIEDNEEDAKTLTEETLADYFRLRIGDLGSLEESSFIDKIRQLNLQAEQLDSLAYFIDEYAGLQEELAEQLLFYRHYIALVDFLEREYQFVSFDHITRKNLLRSQLKP